MKAIKHTNDSLKVADIAARNPHTLISFKSDRRTVKAVERAFELGTIDVFWQTMQFKYIR